jgi:hypothetical protein
MKVTTCSDESHNMLRKEPQHAQMKAATCSDESHNMLRRSHNILRRKPQHAQMKATMAVAETECPCGNHER